MSNLKVSIITVCYNSVRTLSDTINSVFSQTYHNIEYIIIDGSSTDGTIELIKSFGDKINIFKSEPDKGIYDAINKGIKLATGDIVGILNSDDILYDNNVIMKIAETFDMWSVDSVYGDVLFFDPDKTSRITRYYSSGSFSLNKFKFGFMPAHPSFYVKRKIYEELGYYKTDYKIAADYELLIRFLSIHRIKYKYLGMPFVSMRTGGVSNKSISSNITLNKEIARACRENGIKTNYLFIYLKYFIKIFEYFGKRVSG